jgi:hypothetical protein
VGSDSVTSLLRLDVSALLCVCRTKALLGGRVFGVFHLCKCLTDFAEILYASNAKDFESFNFSLNLSVEGVCLIIHHTQVEHYRLYSLEISCGAYNFYITNKV